MRYCHPISGGSVVRQMKKALGFVLALAFAAAASAQAYKWVDKDGKVRYGDTPPPGVKATPLRGAPPPPAPAPSADAKKDPGAKDKEKPLTPEAAFRKRQQEQQEAEQKAQKEAADAAAKRANCESSQQVLRTLQSGQRVTRTDASGERIYLEDAEREQAIQRAQGSVNQWCR
jgi:hypothetical protein